MHLEKTIEALIHVLENGNEANRCFAAQALGHIGANEAVSPLIERLRDEDEDVAIDAAYALGLLKDPQAIPFLWECYIHDPSGDVKVSVIEALGKIGGDNIVDNLITVVQGRGDEIVWELDGDWDDWWDAQLKAIEALGKIGHRKGVMPILNAIDDEENQELTEVGFKALASMGDEGIDHLIKRFKINIPLHRRRVIKALSNHNSDRAKQVFVSGLQDSDVSVRMIAADALAKQEDPEYVPHLLALLKDLHPQARQKIVALIEKYELTNFLTRQDTKNFLALFHDKDVSVRRQAIETTGNLKIMEFSNKVLDAIHDPDAGVAIAAIEALGQLKIKESVQSLAAILLKKELGTRYRSTAALALGNLVDKEEIPFLINTLKDDDRLVRLNSLIAISRLDQEHAIPILLAALHGKLVLPPKEEKPEELAEVENSPESVDESVVETAGDAEAETETVEQDIEELEEEEEQGPQSTLEAIAASHNQETPGNGEEAAVLSEVEKEFLAIAEENIRVGNELLSRQTLAPHQDIRQFAARLLGELGGKQVVEALIQSLQSADFLVQQEAAESLGIVGDVGAIEPLIPLLKSENPDVQLKTSRALGCLQATSAIPQLLECLAQGNTLVRIQVLQALGEIVGGNSPVELAEVLKTQLQLCLKDQEMGVRKAAAEALLQLRDLSVVAAIVEMTFMDEGNQRVEVSRLLRQFIPEQASVEFLKILTDPAQEYYHRIAIEELQEIYRQESTTVV